MKIPVNYDYFRSLILPLYEIDKFMPKKGKILDLGCAEGVIAKYLAKNKSREVIGVDKDAARLPKLKTENLSFKQQDLTTIRLKKINGVIISDVLHHLSLKDQNKLLSKVASYLNRQGTLIIKEIDTDEFIRSKLSRLWDFILYPSDKIYFSSSKKMVKVLNKLGFRVDLFRPCRFFPGSTTLYVCKK